MTCPRCSALLEENARFCDDCGEKISVPPPDPLLGRRLLDEYTITKKIGGGGFGAVYQATQTSMNRTVAIKVLHKQLSDNVQLVKRFHREGMAASKLDHPSAVKMFTSGQTEDAYHWIAMEWLEGESLDKRIRRGAMSLGELLEIFIPLFEVLAEAHAKGIFHRDLKPENVMLTPYVNGKILPKLLDFGIAGVTSDRMTLAENSMVVSGTPQYMPPEQWMGLAFTDARTDIYALGVIAYQCLSQKLPFKADTAPAWRQQHCEATPMPLEKLELQGNLKLPSELVPKISEVLLKALAKDVEARYQTTIAFKEALQAIASDASPTAQREILTHKLQAIKKPDPEQTTTLPPEQKLPLNFIVGSAIGVGAIVIATAAMLGGFGRATPIPSKDFRKIAYSQPTAPASTPTSTPISAPAIISAETPKPPTPLLQTLRKKESSELLASVVALSNNELYAAGDFGRILRSTDAGKTWELLETGADAWLNGLWVSPDKAIFAAGADGLLLRYSNDKWETLKSNTTDQLYAIIGVEKSTLVAVGAFGTILRSTNNGDTWSLVRSDSNDELRDLWTDQRGVVFIVGANGAILRSSDFGQTWQKKSSPSDNALFSIAGKGSTLTIVGDQGTILASNDSGETFTQKKSGTKEMLNRVVLDEAQGTLIAGNGGLLLRSSDGESFSPFAQGTTTQNLYGLCASPSGDTFAAGYNNEIIKISAAGAAELLQSGATPPLSSIWGRGDSELYTVGAAGSLLRSTDAGSTWSEINMEASVYLSGLWASGDGALFIVGDEGAIFTSTDGLSWQSRDSGTKETLSNISGTPSGELFIVGGVGLILRSTDKGQTWQKLSSGSASNLVNIWASEDGTLFVAGLNGTMLRSKDRGDTWEKLTTQTTADLIGLWGRNEKELYTSGGEGTILRTEDGGDTWRPLNNGTKVELNGLWGDETRLMAVGKGGTALASIDKGATWVTYPTNTKQGLNFIWGNPGGDVYIVGNNGTLLTYKN